MPTIINPNVSEPIVYDKLHVDEFTISHVRSEAPPPRRITVKATAYGEDSQGKRRYDPSTYEEEIKDLDPILLNNWCQKNGKTLADAIAKIQEYKVKLATDFATGAIDELFLMAATEMAVGRVIEIMGVFDILEINN